MSKPYIIAYDLYNPGQKYEDIKKIIDSFGGAYIRLQKSLWLVKNNETPYSMTNAISKALDGNDRLFICELVDNYNGIDTKENWEFIKNNIFN